MFEPFFSGSATSCVPEQSPISRNAQRVTRSRYLMILVVESTNTSELVQQGMHELCSVSNRFKGENQLGTTR